MRIQGAPVTARRRQQCDFYHLLLELRHCPDMGEKVMRMSVNQFDWLVHRLSPHLFLTHINLIWDDYKKIMVEKLQLLNGLKFEEDQWKLKDGVKLS